MQITGGVNIRAAWYDRNPLTIGLSYVAEDLGPHAETVRDTYTIPADKKAKIGMVNCVVGTEDDANSFDIASGIVRVTPVVGDPYELLQSGLTRTFGPVPFGTGGNGDVVLVEGDVIEILTNNLSGNGTTGYMCQASLTLFDA